MRLFRVSSLLLVAIPLAFLFRFGNFGPIAVFLAAGLGIIPLAAYMGRATEALAAYLGPQLGGLLNAAFGNAAELILSIMALRRGLYAVVKASLTGSIIGNALLILGMSFLVGGLRHGKQSFDRLMVSLQSTLLVLAAIGLAVPSVLFHRLDRAAEVNLSMEVATVLFLTYCLSVVFSLLRQESGEETVGGAPSPSFATHWSVSRASLVLAVSTVMVAILSEFLAGAIENAEHQGYLERLGMSEVFVGVVLVAVIGNAAEHSTAIYMAYRNQVDLSLHIALGSSLQIALVVTPLLVFASLVVGPQPLDLHFTLLEMLAVIASVVVVAFAASDGQSHWMEGVLLIAVYIILAFAFYHVPAADA